ncbi:MAG: hypothetical protein ACRD19_14560 [Terriglobia bacterium]
MDCRHLENIYELFLLGALGNADAARVQEHLDLACPNCIEGLREATLTLFALLQPSKPVRSTPKQRAHFLQRLKGTQPAAQ